MGDRLNESQFVQILDSLKASERVNKDKYLNTVFAKTADSLPNPARNRN